MGKRLDTNGMLDDFFEEAALIGIVCALPAYKLCWSVNQHFGIDFVCEPSLSKEMKIGGKNVFLPVYQYEIPNSPHRYLLYKLKALNKSLLPEFTKMDYLWFLQTPYPPRDAKDIRAGLLKMPDIILTQLIDVEDVKSGVNLLL